MTSLFSFAVTATTETYTLSLHDALPICHVRALVVGAIVGDVLRARAQAGDRHGHPHPHLGVAVAVLADEAGAVVHQALDAGDRRALHDEEREAHLDVPGVGLETLAHGTQHAAKPPQRGRALAGQDFPE